MLDIILHLIFFVLMLVFIVHSLFLGYHWFTYGSNKKTAMTALATYLLGSAACLLIMSSLIS